jgi:hypothetical protein
VRVFERFRIGRVADNCRRRRRVLRREHLHNNAVHRGPEGAGQSVGVQNMIGNISGRAAPALTGILPRWMTRRELTTMDIVVLQV